MRMLPAPGSREFAAPNPPEGAILTYVLRTEGGRADSVVKLTVTDQSGATVRTLSGPGAQGVHRLAWDLHYARVDGVTDQDEGWFGPPRGPWVLPGTYTVTLEARGRKSTQSVEVRPDPRINATREALVARHTAELQLQDLLRTFVSASKLWDAMAKEKKRVDDALKDRAPLRDSLSASLKDVGTRLDSLGRKFRPGFGGPKFRYLDLDGAMQASSTTPTESQHRELKALGGQLSEDIAALNALLTGAFADLMRRTASVGSASELKPVAAPRM